MHHFWRRFGKCSKTHPSPWQESTHIHRGGDTQHALICCRSRRLISNVKLTGQNESPWHQTCIVFPLTSCQRRAFTHFSWVRGSGGAVFSHGLCSLVMFAAQRPWNCQETTFSREAALNLHFSHNKNFWEVRSCLFKSVWSCGQRRFCCWILFLSCSCAGGFISFLPFGEATTWHLLIQTANNTNGVAFPCRATENTGNDRTASPSG